MPLSTVPQRFPVYTVTTWDTQAKAIHYWSVRCTHACACMHAPSHRMMHASCAQRTCQTTSLKKPLLRFCLSPCSFSFPSVTREIQRVWWLYERTCAWSCWPVSQGHMRCALPGSSRTSVPHSYALEALTCFAWYFRTLPATIATAFDGPLVPVRVSRCACASMCA